MRTLSIGHERVGWTFACALIVCFGCSRDGNRPSALGPRQAGTAQHEQRKAVRVDRLFGKYVITDYAWCSVPMHEESDAWARGHLCQEAAILPEVFAVRGLVVLNPRYEVRDHPGLVEGEVPVGVRRRLSDFYGVGVERDVVTVLEVYEPGAASPRCGVEIIDGNTLWDTWDGPWLFEWRREGTGNSATPLKERLPKGIN